MPITDSKKAAVLGWPVSHSLSPRLHNYWLRQYDIKGSYDAIATEPENLKRVLLQLQEKGYVGANLTLPHKEQAISLMDSLDEKAKRIGAVNTILMKDGKMVGKNTDAYGFIENLKSSDVAVAEKKSLVLGAGGAARAVCAGLMEENCEIILTNRTRGKAELLAASLKGNITVIDWAEIEQVLHTIHLLVNTTSLGMKGQQPLDLMLDALPKEAVVTDIVYSPLITPLLKTAQAQKLKTVDGLGMLLYQAQPAFEAWFGVKPEVTSGLRTHMLAGFS